MSTTNPPTFRSRWRAAVWNCAAAPTEKLTLLALAEFANADGGDCYPSAGTLADVTGASEKTVRGALQAGMTLGFIRRARRGRAARLEANGYAYQLVLPDSADSRSVKAVQKDRRGGREDAVAITGTYARQDAATATGTCPEDAVATTGTTWGGCGKSRGEDAVTITDDTCKSIPEDQEHKQRALARAGARVFETGNGFEQFWLAYPKKLGKQGAAKSWSRQRLAEHADRIVADVTARAELDPGWREPRFIPHPRNYLDGRRWEDDWRSASRGVHDVHDGPRWPISKTVAAAYALQAAADQLDPPRARIVPNEFAPPQLRTGTER